MIAMAGGRRGSQSLKVRFLAEDLVRDIEPRDLLSQMAAGYYWYLKHHVYVKDPVRAEMVRDPEAVIEDVEQNGKFLGDCDCAATFLTGFNESLGIPSRPKRVGFYRIHGMVPFSHVLVEARDQYGRQVVIDPVAGQRTVNMLRRTKRFG